MQCQCARQCSLCICCSLWGSHLQWPACHRRYTQGVYGPCACGRFAFIGSPALCYNQCTAQYGAQFVSSPNNNAEADGMASIIAHELAESVTDPQINAWCAPCTPAHASLSCPLSGMPGVGVHQDPLCGCLPWQFKAKP